jgi:heme a synthase
MEHEGSSRLTMSLRRYRQIAIVTVAGVCFLTIAGAIVRLTGSGLGCDDWPNCNAERFIDVSSGHAAIEQINRLVSGLVGIPTVLMAIGAFRVRPVRRGLKVPSVAVLVTVLGNGVVGGLAVRGDLHPFLVQSHFLLAMVSIAFGLVAIHRARPEQVRHRATIGVTPLVARLVVVVGVLVAAALATGTVVTGAGPHAGDETARRYGFDISTVAAIHSVTVWVGVAAFLGLVAVLRRDPAPVPVDVAPRLDVDVRRRRAGRHRVPAVLQRRPRGAGGSPCRRGHRVVGGHGAVRPGDPRAARCGRPQDSHRRNAR